MTVADATALVQRLHAAFPFPVQSDETLVLLTEKMLTGWSDGVRAARAVERWVDFGERFPVWSQLRALYGRQREAGAPEPTPERDVAPAAARRLVRDIFAQAITDGDLPPGLAERLGIASHDAAAPGDTAHQPEPRASRRGEAGAGERPTLRNLPGGRAGR